MTFLVLKIYLYIGLAMLIGAGLGVMLRRKDDQPVNTSDELLEMQSKVSQLESAVLERDQAIGHLQEKLDNTAPAEPGETSDEERKLVADLAGKNEQIAALRERIRDLEKSLDGEERPDPEHTDTLISALHGEIARLKDELERALQSPSRSSEELDRTVKELEARLLRKASELDRLEQALAREERKVRELERERDLQNKSLHVLHQQLELERARPQEAASGG